MQVLGLTSSASKRKQRELKRLGRVALNIFLFTLLMPILVYGLFYYGIFESSNNKGNSGIETAIALVLTPTGTGSAFIVGESILLTACHVVSDVDVGSELTVNFENADPPISTKAVLRWKDVNYRSELMNSENDLAVLELVNPSHATEDMVRRLIFGDSDDINIQDEVIILGYPDADYYETSGGIGSTTYKDNDQIFQLDVSAYPGNSGGPIVLRDTEYVIGMLLAGKTGEFAGINLGNKINNIDYILSNNGIDYSE
jgi:S1-C subfamily serine protease